MKRLLYACSIITSSMFITSCEREEPPTKTSMEGVWELTEATDSDGTDVTSNLKFPIAAFHLSSDNTMISTGGPMFMFIVYGNNNYTNIASKVDQVFNYAGLDFNGGEFFVEGGVVDRFTVEMKLEGLPGQKTLTDLLDLLGVTQDYFDLVIYHKFMDVKVTFEDEGEELRNLMIWEFDDITTAVYNTKDKHGNYVLWHGWPIDKFSRAKFVFRKSAKDLKTLVSDAV